MKKGFTLVEILATIVIISVILLISVPLYNKISDSIKESTYKSKIEEVKAKASSYASEQSKFVFDIKTLIEAGYLSSDNELGEFKDPRNNRDMQCDVINVVYKNNQYNVSITESDICYNNEELESLYGMVILNIEDENGNIIEKNSDTEWLKKNKVYVSYKLKSEYEEYQNSIENIVWLGEEEKSCNKENIDECQKLEVTAEEIKNVTISIQIKINVNNTEIINTVSKNILLDLQRPIIVDGSLIVDNSVSTNSLRKVEFELSDQIGSGIKYYSIVKEKTCASEEYEENKTLAESGIQRVYLPNGSYYICVEDKVGNKTSDSDLDNKNNQITVDNVVTEDFNIDNLSITSKNKNYHSLDALLSIEVNNKDASKLKMCISNTGYMIGCSWETYQTSKDWQVSGSLDGGLRKVYVSVIDEAGNIANRTVEYTVYKDCSNQQKVYIESSYGTCSKPCGGGLQYRAYQMKDTLTGTICKIDKDSKTCNTQSCMPDATDKIIDSGDTISSPIYDNDYRYRGSNPNNYVYFNCDDYNNQNKETCDIWRIMGAFKTTNASNVNEYRLKIINTRTLGSRFTTNYDPDIIEWDKSNYCSDLNTKFYNTLNDETKKFIEPIYWNIGIYTAGSASTKNILELYNYEKSKKWLGNVGMMSSSDYYWGFLDDKFVSPYKSSWNWLFLKAKESTMTLAGRYVSDTTLMRTIDSSSTDVNGDIYYRMANLTGGNRKRSYSIRPVLSIKSNVKIKSGNGTKDDPYQLFL